MTDQPRSLRFIVFGEGVRDNRWHVLQPDAPQLSYSQPHTPLSSLASQNCSVTTVARVFPSNTVITFPAIPNTSAIQHNINNGPTSKPYSASVSSVPVNLVPARTSNSSPNAHQHGDVVHQQSAVSRPTQKGPVPVPVPGPVRPVTVATVEPSQPRHTGGLITSPKAHASSHPVSKVEPITAPVSNIPIVSSHHQQEARQEQLNPEPLVSSPVHAPRNRQLRLSGRLIATPTTISKPSSQEQLQKKSSNVPAFSAKDTVPSNAMANKAPEPSSSQAPVVLVSAPPLQTTVAPSSKLVSTASKLAPSQPQIEMVVKPVSEAEVAANSVNKSIEKQVNTENAANHKTSTVPLDSNKGTGSSVGDNAAAAVSTEHSTATNEARDDANVTDKIGETQQEDTHSISIVPNSVAQRARARRLWERSKVSSKDQFQQREAMESIISRRTSRHRAPSSKLPGLEKLTPKLSKKNSNSSASTSAVLKNSEASKQPAVQDDVPIPMNRTQDDASVKGVEGSPSETNSVDIGGSDNVVKRPVVAAMLAQNPVIEAAASIPYPGVAVTTGSQVLGVSSTRLTEEPVSASEPVTARTIPVQKPVFESSVSTSKPAVTDTTSIQKPVRTAPNVSSDLSTKTVAKLKTAMTTKANSSVTSAPGSPIAKTMAAPLLSTTSEEESGKDMHKVTTGGAPVSVPNKGTYTKLVTVDVAPKATIVLPRKLSSKENSSGSPAPPSALSTNIPSTSANKPSPVAIHGSSVVSTVAANAIKASNESSKLSPPASEPPPASQSRPASSMLQKPSSTSLKYSKNTMSNSELAGEVSIAVDPCVSQKREPTLLTAHGSNDAINTVNVTGEKTSASKTDKNGSAGTYVNEAGVSQRHKVGSPALAPGLNPTGVLIVTSKGGVGTHVQDIPVAANALKTPSENIPPPLPKVEERPAEVIVQKKISPVVQDTCEGNGSNPVDSNRRDIASENVSAVMAPEEPLPTEYDLPVERSRRLVTPTKRERSTVTDEPVMAVFKHLIKTVVTYNQKFSSFRGRQFVEDRKTFLREILQKLSERGKMEPAPVHNRRPSEIESPPHESAAMYDTPVPPKTGSSYNRLDVVRKEKLKDPKDSAARQTKALDSHVKPENHLAESHGVSSKSTTTRRESSNPAELGKTDTGGIVGSSSIANASSSLKKTGVDANVRIKSSDRMDTDLRMFRKVGTKFIEWKKEFMDGRKPYADIGDTMRRVSESLSSKGPAQVFEDVTNQELLTWLVELKNIHTTIDNLWKPLSNDVLASRGILSPKEKEELKRKTTDQIEVVVYVVEWCNAVISNVLNRYEMHSDGDGDYSDLAILERFNSCITTFLEYSESQGDAKNQTKINLLARLRIVSRNLNKIKSEGRTPMNSAIERLNAKYKDLAETASGLSAAAKKFIDTTRDVPTNNVHAHPSLGSSGRTVSNGNHNGIARHRGRDEDEINPHVSRSSRYERSIQELSPSGHSSIRQPFDDGGSNGGIEPPANTGPSLKRKINDSSVYGSGDNRDDRRSSGKRRATEPISSGEGLNDRDKARKNSGHAVGGSDTVRPGRDFGVYDRRDERVLDVRNQSMRNSGAVPEQSHRSKGRDVDLRLNDRSTQPNDCRSTDDFPPIPKMNASSNVGTMNARGGSGGATRGSGKSGSARERSAGHLREGGLLSHDNNDHGRYRGSCTNGNRNGGKKSNSSDSLNFYMSQLSAEKKDGATAGDRKSQLNNSSRSESGSGSGNKSSSKQRDISDNRTITQEKFPHRTNSMTRQRADEERVSIENANRDRIHSTKAAMSDRGRVSAAIRTSSQNGAVLETRQRDRPGSKLVPRQTPQGPFVPSANRSEPSTPVRPAKTSTIIDGRRVYSILKVPKTGIKSSSDKNKKRVRFNPNEVSGAAPQDRSKDELITLFSDGFDILGDKVPLQKEAIEERVPLLTRGTLSIAHGLITRLIENCKREAESAPIITSDRMRLPYAPSSVRLWAREFGIPIPVGRPNINPQNNNIGRPGVSGFALNLRSAPAPMPLSAPLPPPPSSPVASSRNYPNPYQHQHAQNQHPQQHQNHQQYSNQQSRQAPPQSYAHSHPSGGNGRKL